MAGMTLTLVLESYDVFAGWFDGTDPYIHIATEMAVFCRRGRAAVRRPCQEEASGQPEAPPE
jgi:hypothetical protein